MTIANAALPPPLDEPDDAALQHGSWRGFGRLSSVCSSQFGMVERFLEASGFDRGPWLAVGFGGGAAAWFALANRAQ